MCAKPMKIKMAGWELINCSAARLQTVHQLVDMHVRMKDIGVEPTDKNVDRKWQRM